MNPDPVPTIPSQPGGESSNARQSSTWDLANAPRNYISLVLTQGASAVFSFASVWLITQYLGSEGYGGIVAVIAASQVAQVLVNWTSVAVVRFGVDEFIETAKIARTFWVRLIALVINLVLVIAVSALWFPPLAVWLKLSPDTYWLVLAHFAVTALWVHIQMSLQGAKMLRLQGVLMMIERLLILLGIIAFLAAASLTPTAAIRCYIVAPAAMTLAGAFALRRYVFTRFAVDRTFLRKLFVYSLPLLPFSLVGFFSGSYIDAVFVANYLSTRDLGVYSLATQINGVVLQLPTLANSLLLPLFVTLQSETATDRITDYFRSVLPSLTLLWGLACTLLAYLATFAIPAIFAEEFHFAVLPLWTLLTATAVFFPVMVGYAALSNATSTTYVSMFAATFAAVANIVANCILIPSYGALGCALATLIAFITSAATFLVLLHREFKTPFSWTPFSVLPVLIGTAIAIVWQSPIFAVLGCAAISFLIAAWFHDSLGRTVVFLKNVRSRRQ